MSTSLVAAVTPRCNHQKTVSMLFERGENLLQNGTVYYTLYLGYAKVVWKVRI